ncbi:protein PHYTOCHROME-DEPENDENT LATE-FLOWERING isoform X2 [Benincasa hispida]|uniref:protein PHYTOCHROME-DEPENDENT LATE-FLOWERING isoform X2 n=1 Tax=Benincasa hispida TaxID=102211 RepID=UPI0018FF80AC|nr:protein PHYTOCHROME-DEPENDENT LATE-FLOWERING isoform X2 [Benincasa hispida]
MLRTLCSLFLAIECGWLPGDILDDIPCKYFDGTIVCEVRDFRGRLPEPGPGAQSTDRLPTVHKIHLRLSLENVVKDIPLISDNSWTYGDLMEVESRILKALQPQLNLNPAPTLDRLCNSPVPMKLSFSQYSKQRKRLRQLSEVSISSNSRYGKKICIDRVPESFNTRLGDSGVVSGNLNAPDNVAGQNMSLNEMIASRPKNLTSDASLPAQSAVPVSQSRYSMGSGTPRGMLDQAGGSVLNPSGVSPSGQEMISYADNLNPNVSLHAKRETQDGQMSPLPSFNKRSRPSLMGIDGIQPHPLASMESPQGSDMNWKNMLQQQAIARGIQYSNPGVQKFSPQMFEGVLNQDSVQIPFATGQSAMRYGAKEEQFDSEKMDGSDLSRSKPDMQMMETENHQDPQHPRVQQRPPQQAFVRSNPSQPPWNNFGQHIEKETRKEDQLSKRKSVQSPRVSAGAMAQPSLSKSGEFSSGSGGPHYGVPGNISALASGQKDKPGVNPVSHVCGTPSLTSSANDSMQRQHQAQAAAKRRSNSLPKTPVINGVGSPASVGNMSVPLNANSPSVGTPPFADQTMIERFSKIEMVAARHQLNLKKSKVNDYPIRKPSTYSAHDVATHLANSFINDDLKDDAGPRKMSKSLIGGSLNACKRRVLTFMLQDRTPQGMVSYVSRLRSRVILSEKPNDGTVALTYEDIDDSIFLAIEDCLPTLPNTLSADLLADQLSSLMVHEGYDLIENIIQLRPTRMNSSPNSQSNATGHPHINPAAEMQNYGEAFPGQTSNEVLKPSGSGNASLLNSSHSLLGNARILPPGNPQAMQMSQGILAGVSLPARPQQVEAQASMLQQQQQQLQSSQQQNQQNLIQPQHQQFQRSVALGTNPLSHLNAIGQNSNVQLGATMVNKSPIPLHLLQQQQQQSPFQRKMMGTVGMGNINNNIMGIGGLASSMGVGASRGIGGTGLQAPMGSIPAMGNAGQNPMNLTQASSFNNTLSQQFRAGTLTPAQAQAAVQAQAAYKFRMAQNRGMLGAASQSTITGIPGARQMHPSSGGLSMLGQQALNRASLTPMQRAVVPMGPPKLMPGINPYMNQQQQQLQQQIQQQQQMQQQQQQPPQQQQLQQHPETTTPLQAVVSPQQVGSPSTMGVQQLNQQQQQQQQQQQSASPQQVNQRTPMSPQQMSSGTIHALSAGNPEVCPASPQLSSQTLGSVSSIANSPMDMQGVNKSNSVNNS